MCGKVKTKAKISFFRFQFRPLHFASRISISISAFALHLINFNFDVRAYRQLIHYSLTINNNFDLDLISRQSHVVYKLYWNQMIFVTIIQNQFEEQLATHKNFFEMIISGVM